MDLTDDLNWLWNFIETSAKPKSIHQAREYKNIVIVEFNTYKDAKRVISELNYSKLDGFPIRMIEFKKFDKNACILVNNLDLSIEASQLHDSLSNFGEVLTCKIPLITNPMVMVMFNL